MLYPLSYEGRGRTMNEASEPLLASQVSLIEIQ